MNIVDALIAHHGVLRQLYQQSEANPDMFEEFVRHLIVHHTMEEKYFYDILQEVAEARHGALEAVNEHHIIEMIIKDSERFPRDHELFEIKIEGLGEYTVHHLDEEEAEVFPLALQLFTPEEVAIMGKLFLEAKDKLLAVKLPELPAQLMKKRKSEGLKAEKQSPEVKAKGSTADGLGIGSLK